MKLFKTILISLAAISAAQTAYAQDSSEMYYIFDLKTDVSSKDLGKVIAKGIKKHAPKAQTSSHLIMGEPPATPGRFEIVDMSDQFGDNLGGLMALAKANGSAAAFKTAKCDGAVWTGKFTKNSKTQNLSFDTCLYPYQGGYSLQVYAQDTDKGHGQALHRQAVGGLFESVVGKPEERAQKALTRMRRKLFEDAGVMANLVEGQPKLDFTFKGEEASMIKEPDAGSGGATEAQPAN